MRSKFLAKRHKWCSPWKLAICAVFGGASELLQPWKDLAFAALCRPQRCESPGTKHWPFGFRGWAGLAAELYQAKRAWLECVSAFRTAAIEGVAPQEEICMRRGQARARGTRG